MWGAKEGYGASINLDFGQPFLKIREPIKSNAKSKRVREILSFRQVIVSGEWHLWIYICDWFILQKGETIAKSILKVR